MKAMQVARENERMDIGKRKQTEKAVDDLKEEREVFEWFQTTQSKINPALLARADNGSYVDTHVSLMFVGFCIGWKAKSNKESLQFRKDIKI